MTLAAVMVLGSTVAVAADKVTSKDIKNNTIQMVDLNKSLKKKINKKGRKGKKGSGGGRVTQGRAPLRLPNLDPSDLPQIPGQKGKKGLPSLPGLDLPSGSV